MFIDENEHVHVTTRAPPPPPNNTAIAVAVVLTALLGPPLPLPIPFAFMHVIDCFSVPFGSRRDRRERGSFHFTPCAVSPCANSSDCFDCNCAARVG